MTDIILDIATGRSRKELHWKNKTIAWLDLAAKLSQTHRTAETVTEYASVPKSRQDEIKDVGGFVGGALQGGRRKPEAVIHRQLITLDIDFATADMWEDFTILYDCAALVYSTHKHTPAAPRLRLLIPLDRPVSVTEYEAIGRRIAGDLGIEAFDHTGFQAYRLMYWPSTSKDGEYFYRLQDGPVLKADQILSTYRDFTDSSSWPVSVKAGDRVRRDITKQGDPLTKRGVIGAFCRRYGIDELISTFLSDIYEPVADVSGLDGEGSTRYTYARGSTAGGLVVYEDKYAYSHHGTDPISGKLCNAFDLFRLHLYGLRDEDTADSTPVTKKPSYKAAMDFIKNLPEMREAIVREQVEKAREDFAEYDLQPEMTGREVVIDKVSRAALGLPVLPVRAAVEDSGAGAEWLKQLELDPKGDGVKCTFANIVTILRNDENLAGRFAFNLFKCMPVVLGALPWAAIDKMHPLGRAFSDRDAADLRGYIETVYKISGPFKLKDALVSVSHENAFHPIRNYLEGLQWDGQERLASALVDYFGAEDTEYTRAVTRKWFIAAVARVFEPGVKFDYTLTLVGVEGIYKSTFFKKMFDPWFTDNFSFHMIGSTRAAEQIQGYWGVEIGELTGLRRGELEGIKAFLTRQQDIQRGAYKEYIAEMPRQNVFAGSTNEDGFLKGVNGNRRFWVVRTRVTDPTKPIKLIDEDRGQLWAEAMAGYEFGETLYLNRKLEAQAREIQEQHTEADDRQEVIEEYLARPLPKGWEDMLIHERRAYLAGAEDDLTVKATEVRQRVSVAEIWTEALGCHVRDMTTGNTKPIHDIMRKIKGWKPYKSRTMFKGYGNQRGYARDTENTTSD